MRWPDLLVPVESPEVAARFWLLDTALKQFPAFCWTKKDFHMCHVIVTSCR